MFDALDTLDIFTGDPHRVVEPSDHRRRYRHNAGQTHSLAYLDGRAPAWYWLTSQPDHPVDGTKVNALQRVEPVGVSLFLAMNSNK